jgi:hypothetical protein
MGADKQGAPAPLALRLDPEGFCIFSKFDGEERLRARTLSGFAAGWHGKNSGRALRLALVFEMLAWATRGGAEPLMVSVDSIVRACAFLDYAAAMLDRVQGGLGIGRAEMDAATIARHIVTTRATKINERELYRASGFTWLRDAERRTRAIAVLRALGWIRLPDVVTGGIRPRGDWNVSPMIVRGPL